MITESQKYPIALALAHEASARKEPLDNYDVISTFLSKCYEREYAPQHVLLVYLEMVSVSKETRTKTLADLARVVNYLLNQYFTSSDDTNDKKQVEYLKSFFVEIVLSESFCYIDN